jgi:two-component system chemotaxis response regulator CheB
LKPNEARKDLRILVVDDTILYRKVVSDVLAEIPGVMVVGTAHNGRIAMQRIAELKPNLLTLDIEMPEMDGLEVLRQMAKHSPETGAIMLSSHTREGSKMAIKAIEMGAFDFICKPHSGTLDENRTELKKTIAPMIRAFSRLLEVKQILKGKRTGKHFQKEGVRKAPEESIHREKVLSSRQYTPRAKIIAVGISTGGPVALARLFSEMPAHVGIPFLIVQHMPPLFTESLARNLDRQSAITVREARDGDEIVPNTAYIAPGGKQMRIANDIFKKAKIIRITEDPPENGCAPSADYLFRSVAAHYGELATGVIMTGMGSDGTKGLKAMKEKGAFIIAQDEASSVVFGMAKKAVESGVVDVVTPLNQISLQIRRTIDPKLKGR